MGCSTVKLLKLEKKTAQALFLNNCIPINMASAEYRPKQLQIHKARSKHKSLLHIMKSFNVCTKACTFYVNKLKDGSTLGRKEILDTLPVTTDLQPEGQNYHMTTITIHLFLQTSSQFYYFNPCCIRQFLLRPVENSGMTLLHVCRNSKVRPQKQVPKSDPKVRSKSDPKFRPQIQTPNSDPKVRTQCQIPKSDPKVRFQSQIQKSHP